MSTVDCEYSIGEKKRFMGFIYQLVCSCNNGYTLTGDILGFIASRIDTESFDFQKPDTAKIAFKAEDMEQFIKTVKVINVNLFSMTIGYFLGHFGKFHDGGDKYYRYRFSDRQETYPIIFNILEGFPSVGLRWCFVSVAPCRGAQSIFNADLSLITKAQFDELLRDHSKKLENTSLAVKKDDQQKLVDFINDLLYNIHLGYTVSGDILKFLALYIDTGKFRSSNSSNERLVFGIEDLGNFHKLVKSINVNLTFISIECFLKRFDSLYGIEYGNFVSYAYPSADRSKPLFNVFIVHCSHDDGIRWTSISAAKEHYNIYNGHNLLTSSEIDDLLKDRRSEPSLSELEEELNTLKLKEKQLSEQIRQKKIERLPKKLYTIRLDPLRNEDDQPYGHLKSQRRGIFTSQEKAHTCIKDYRFYSQHSECFWEFGIELYQGEVVLDEVDKVVKLYDFCYCLSCPCLKKK